MDDDTTDDRPPDPRGVFGQTVFFRATGDQLELAFTPATPQPFKPRAETPADARMRRQYDPRHTPLMF